MASPLSAEGFAAATGVSRETLARLQIYLALLEKWQRAINLVSQTTFSDVWRRHFLDSAQLLPLAPAGAQLWLDVGSGAGFPGLVLAIVGARRVHLVESDQRKAAFLREVARETATPNAMFHVKRIEAVTEQDLGGRADVVTARAVAPPNQVLAWTAILARPDATFLLPTGRTAGQALTRLQENPNMVVEELPSRTDASSRILRIRGVSSDGVAGSSIHA